MKTTHDSYDRVMPYESLIHMNESWRIWWSHGIWTTHSYEWVMAHMMEWWHMNDSFIWMSRGCRGIYNHFLSHVTFLDGYCTTIQGLVDWFEVPSLVTITFSLHFLPSLLESFHTWMSLDAYQKVTPLAKVNVKSARITCFRGNPIPLPSIAGSDKSEKLKESP